MSNKEYTTILMDSLQAALKPLGFRKKGTTLVQTIGDDIAQMVNLQKSTSSNSLSIQATVNLGVFSYAVSRVCDCPGIRSGSTPSVWDCHWNERIGHLMPGTNDHWWTVQSMQEAIQAGDEIATAVMCYGIPALEEVNSTDRLRALWQRGLSPGLSDKQRDEYLAALASPEQWQEQGSRRLREALARLDERETR